MTRRTLLALVAFGALSAAAIATLIALVFSSTDTTEHPGTDAGYAIDPIGTKPADVAVAVMSGIFTWQPTVQDSSWDALHSQQDRLTGTMATAAAQPPTLAPQPLPEWAAWARSGDTITAVVRPDGDTVINGDTATVPVTITQTVQHTDGSATPYTNSRASVTLQSLADAWMIANYQLQELTR